MERSSKNFPLYAKATGTADYEVITRLATNPQQRLFWEKAKGWTQDASRLANMPPLGQLEVVRFTDDELKSYLDIGKIRVMDPTEPAHGTVKGFKVIQWDKERKRGIFHPKVQNDLISKQQLQKYSCPTKQQIRHAVHAGDFSITLDFTSCFDQHVLSRANQRFFCFVAMYQGKLQRFCLLTLPQGYRPSVEVAQGGTWILSDMSEIPEVSVQTLTDNVRFTGDFCHVLRAATLFCQRVRDAGMMLNEIDVYHFTTNDLCRLVVQKNDFLGEAYDYAKKTVRSTEKVMAKLAATWEKRYGWTNRTLAGHFGLLFYASSTMAHRLFPYFGLLRRFRSLSSSLTKDPSLWDQKFEGFSLTQWQEMQRWTEFILRNEPRPIALVGTIAEFHYLLFVDSSKFGWGATTFRVEDGSVRVFTGQWPTGFTNIRRFSARAEPEGIWRSVCHAFPANVPLCVLCLTDHEPFTFAGPKGYSKSWYVNEVIRKVDVFFPLLKMLYQYLPGLIHPTDDLSRGVVSTTEYDQSKTASAAKQILGDLQLLGV